ncbi:MAG: FAD-dependent monooxygenase [Pyrinomonadaceae bacterium]|nr:FAD-dependent monooxygenase [Pyrinomonadaceae bacterium]
MSKVIIIGAGLAGSLLSTFFAKRGIATDVYEARGDMRKEEMSAGRSINLALSDRGIRALSAVGMDDYMLKEAVPMYGRLIHPVAGSTKLLPYSGREGEYINSVSRGGLNEALIDEADKYPASTFHFHERCVGFDCESGEARFRNTETGEEKTIKGETVIATDGAGSAVRQSMMNRGVERFNYSQHFLKHGYKELRIPPVSEFKGEVPETANGEFLLEKNALHIWARHQYMMIALPNFDGSFTCTLFLAFEGKDSFEAIENGTWGLEKSSRGSAQMNADSEKEPRENEDPKEFPSSSFRSASDPRSSAAKIPAVEALIRFYEVNFPDAVLLMPDLVEDFFDNPTGDLGTVKCFPWNVGGKALLLGDSAHAIVPFYGQGMNAAFEDCRILDGLIDSHGLEWETVFTEYSELRKVNTDAIADLAVENFYEMRDHVADPVFVRKRDLETKLEREYPDYFSKYSLVTFREDIPYSEAQRRGNSQNEVLMKLCEDISDISELDMDEVMAKVSDLEY